MDEGLLNDLLECSVCLERLDTSSRVLPCQHTFCLKCLKEIVESHKELRCPECRVLVEAKVEELPPNVLLMRILEGMRNSAPRKIPAQRTPRTAHSQTPTQQAGPQRAETKQLPPHARAIYDYISKEPGDLSFKKGETVLLQKKLDPFWFQGECSGRTGMFPITYVQVVVPLPTATALSKALYDFRMSAPDEEGCLAFDKGAIITVHRRVDENWAEGRLEQRVGIFPIAFVELNHAARQLMNSAPLNRAVPPLPEASRPTHTEHRHHAQQHPHRYQPISMSTPAPAAPYQSLPAMSQSHAFGTQTHYSPRNIVEPHTKHSLDLIHFTAHGKHTVGVQSVSRIDAYDRVRGKFDAYAADATYQNVRQDHVAAVASFDAPAGSDTSSSANTPSGAGSTPSSDTTGDSGPSPPSSPDDPPEPAEPEPPTASMGVLSLNESSTATNTSLNVSLPPPESPKPEAPSQVETQEAANDPPRLEPSSSKCLLRSSGPDSLLNFGLGLQAALSPSHGIDANYLVSAKHRDYHREKRHSLTPSTHLQGNHATQNRHSAEISTSLLDAGERRRRRSRSNERPLPAAYVALYPYRPQKADELELTKGAVYTVTERCRDGWYKGYSERAARSGVFPGNYVVPAHRHRPDKSAPAATTVAPSPAPKPAPPDAPPRAHSPISAAAQLTYPWNTLTSQQQSTPRSEKCKDKGKSEKSAGASLMKRLAAMKRCRSPPAHGYSLDNPVFDDGPPPLQMPHHVRGAGESPWQSQHRKSQSLDVTPARRERHHSQTVKERFRCIAPYPPNSEYELELKVDDIVVVCKKRGDGWYKGTLQRTGRTGLFPASFVQSCPRE